MGEFKSESNGVTSLLHLPMDMFLVMKAVCIFCIYNCEGLYTVFQPLLFYTVLTPKVKLVHSLLFFLYQSQFVIQFRNNLTSPAQSQPITFAIYMLNWFEVREICLVFFMSFFITGTMMLMVEIYHQGRQGPAHVVHV